MPNIASVFKEEIARIARKEMRRHIDPLRKQVSAQRSSIAELKRELAQAQKALARLQKAQPAAAPVAAADAGGDAAPARFSAAGLRSLRARLGLSAADFAQLIGVTGQSVYNWEQEKSRPRQSQVQQIAALRGIGKKEARARLGEAQ